MDARPPFADALTLIDEGSAVLRDVAATAPGLDAPVPGCPAWTLGDLVAHLARVHRFWALVATAGPADGPPSLERVPAWAPDTDLLAWSRASTDLMVESLRTAGPDAGCWSWWPASAAPLTVGAVARHQVQEAAVHAFDAQQATGRPQPLPAAVAVDGVAEFLEVCLGAKGAWPHRPARVVLHATEGPSWTVDLSPSGAHAHPAAGGEPVTTVHGAASELVLFLYRRLVPADLRIDGDRAVAAGLHDWCVVD